MSFDRAALAEAIAAHGPVARVLVLEARGSAPREAGTAMLVWPGGQSGTIGGGALEWEASAMARARLAERAGPVVVEMPLGPALDQCCGGHVTLALEVFAEAPPEAPAYARPLSAQAGPMPLAISRALAQARSAAAAPRLARHDGWLIEPMRASQTPLWIWGAGHVGRALVDVLAPLERFAITWLDTDAARFPAAPRVAPMIAADLPARVAAAPAQAHHLILTYSHSIDLALCAALARHRFASAGLIGSATKWARFRRRLAADGLTDAQISRITCPIGDPTLGKHPQAIAISTAAQLLSMLEKPAHRNNKRDMTG